MPRSFRISGTFATLCITTVIAAAEAPPIALDDFVVTPSRFGISSQPVVAGATLTAADLTALPQLGEDLYRTIARLPGLVADDFTAKFWVRGAPNAQVLARFDGEQIWATEAGVTFGPPKGRFGGSVLAFWNAIDNDQFERTVPNSTDFVVVSQCPQLHTLRFGAFSQGFRGEGAVRNHRMAVQVSVENRCHRRILGRLARACWLLDQL